MDTSGHQSAGDRPVEPPEPPAGDALREALDEARELKAYASQYLSAKVDGLKLSARKIVVAVALGTIALLVGAVAVVMAASLFLIGLAEAIGVLLGGRRWAGDLIVGGGLLLILAVGSWVGVRMYFRSSRKRTVQRYEKRLREQRAAHGHDARERSLPGAAG